MPLSGKLEQLLRDLAAQWPESADGHRPRLTRLLDRALELEPGGRLLKTREPFPFPPTPFILTETKIERLAALGEEFGAVPEETDEERLNRIIRNAHAMNLGGVRMEIETPGSRGHLSRAEERARIRERWDAVFDCLAGHQPTIIVALQRATKRKSGTWIAILPDEPKRIWEPKVVGCDVDASTVVVEVMHAGPPKGRVLWRSSRVPRSRRLTPLKQAVRLVGRLRPEGSRVPLQQLPLAAAAWLICNLDTAHSDSSGANVARAGDAVIARKLFDASTPATRQRARRLVAAAQREIDRRRKASRLISQSKP